MRATLLLLTPLLVCPSCASDCGPAGQVSGRVYRVWGSFLTVDSRRTVVEATHGSPANGRADWEFAFSADSGPVTVIIDQQPFDGTGEWDPLECGSFQVRWDGEYIDDAGVIHLFEANGDFVIYEERLDGIVGWNETWNMAGETGRFNGRTQLTGEQYSQ